MARSIAELPQPSLTGFTAAQLAFARDAWPMRAAQELRSALIFRALASAARRVPALVGWTERLAAMVADEIRHTRLCATIGARLGAPAVRHDAAPARASSGWSSRA